MCFRAHTPLSGTVFKIERGLAYLRLYAGTLRLRDRVLGGKVTGLGMFDHGTATAVRAVPAGRIATVQGLDVRIGEPTSLVRQHFPPPTLETVVTPVDPAQRVALHAALTDLARRDPLIGLRNDLAISLYGEVQKEVVAATLLAEHGIAVTFSHTEVMCVERPRGTGAAVRFKEHNPYVATVGLRVEPGPSGVRFDIDVELGSLPLSFFTAVEEAVRDELRHGRRWEVTDCVVTMTHSGYFSPVTRRATSASCPGSCSGTRSTPRAHAYSSRYSVSTPALTRLHAIPHTTTPAGGTSVIEGEVPAAGLLDLERRLPGLTRGEAAMETAFHHYREVVELRG